MAEVNDLEPCNCLPVSADHILGVGWLENGRGFPTGPTPVEVYEKLVEFSKHPWQPFAACGSHECSLCQFHGEKMGTANMFFPFEGKIYVCPELITHYINAHHYQPPSLFCDAVLACPPMRSKEYKQLLIACNGRVLWQTKWDAL